MRNRISERISILSRVAGILPAIRGRDALDTKLKMGSRTIFLVLVAVFVLAGCGQKQKEDVDVSARGPEVEAMSPPSEEAARAIEAAGGLDAWKKTTKLQLDCVVTFYQPDGSFYLTEQRYEVHPWLNSIQISADEPQGAFVWQFSNGQFDVLRGAGQIDALPKAVPSRCFAEVILNIITAPARFLDGSVEFTKQSNPVKMQGKWYYPIDRQGKDLTARISDAVFYQDRDGSLVDMIRLACLGSGVAPEKLIQYVRGYDYEMVEKAGPRIPTRIEIFETDARDRTQKRLCKIDCHTVKRTQ
jgi:outer membrane murein-binding lipoprotein Lpp